MPPLQKRMSAYSAYVAPAATIIFAGAMIFAGGSSRVDAPQIIIVRLAAIIAIAGTVTAAPAAMLGQFARGVALPFAALILWAIQLVPLPPSLWLALPGHALLAQSAIIANEAQPWRPLSLSPDLTIEAMLALMVPVAAIILTLSAPKRWLHQAALALMILAVFSAAVATGQAAGGPDSILQWYPAGEADVSTGLLVNRNHQGLLMSLGIPAAFIWATNEQSGTLPRGSRLLIAFAVAALCVIGALITQSRAAIIFVALGAVFAAASLGRDIIKLVGARGAIIAASGSALALAGVAALALPYQRLMAGDANDDRAYFWADTTTMLKAYFPFGSGGGTFVNTYPRFQGMDRLRPEYVNHAHNEVLEFVSENGIAGIVLIAALAWLLVPRMVTVILEKNSSPMLRSGRFAVVVIGFAILASMVDYPLRAPMMTSLIASSAVILYRAHEELRDPPA